MIIDGKKIAEKVLEEIKKEILEKKLTLTLGVILIGEDDTPSLRYINQKRKTAEKLGINFELAFFPSETSEKVILDKITEWNNSPKITAFLIQSPFPEHIRKNKIFETINSLKDADGFSFENQGKVLVGDENGLSACTPSGILEIFKYEKIDLIGKNIVVIGRSNIVGKPLANMLVNSSATVTICNSKTKNLEYFTKNADIIIVATGKKHLLKKEMISKKSIIIDVGFSVEDGKIYGDTDFENIVSTNSITPVPGGVGPLTVAFLMKNVLKSYFLQNAEK